MRQLDLREAWRLSKVPYVEVLFRSRQMTRGSGLRGAAGARSAEATARGTIQGAKLGKLIFTFFICLASAITLYQYSINEGPDTLVAAASFSLFISFSYVLLDLLQVLPSYSSAEPYALLSTLPLSDRDFSLITTFSFVRTFDYLIVGAAAVQGGLVGYLTGSVLAGALMASASLMGSVFAVAIAFWLSGAFYRNINRGGRSKAATLSRFVFLLTWGLTAASVWFLFSFISTMVPTITAAFSGALSGSAALVLAVIHPISAAIAIASLVYPGFLPAKDAAGLSFGAFLLYGCLAVLAAREVLGAAARTARGQNVSTVRVAAKDFLLKLRKPVPAYVLKDLRIASKSPATAFIFALPVFETVLVALNVSRGPLSARNVLSATSIGWGFALLGASTLLITEGSGLDYTLSLPIGPRAIATAKSTVATLAYLPVPVAIAILLTLGSPTSNLLILIPFAEIPAVSAATTVELSFFVRGYKKAGGGSSSYRPTGFSMLSGGDTIKLIEAFGTGLLLGALPILVYTVVFLTGFGHLSAVGAMLATSLGEFGLAQYVSHRM